MKRVAYIMLVTGWLVLLCLGGCGKKALVSVELEQPSELERISSFAWLEEGHKVEADVRVTNPKVQEAVRAAVEKELAKKGIRLIAMGERPDCLVAWFGAIEDKVKVDSIAHFYSSYGYGPLSATLPEGATESANIRVYEEGTIVIDILSRQADSILWRGRGSERLLQGMTEAEAKFYINSLISQILAQLPDTGKKQ